ncbi:hypothetical protein [Sutcliffiella halmapala]|uniref:hypothetical protein n=1 Tax=Sutcliffiella halmapala TaxID=79882 RepID=UPI000994BEFA|nr:hypothetical protein [Sutcliffiella halmapala]
MIKLKVNEVCTTMDAIQIGPLLLKKSILVLLFSCLIAYLYIAILHKREPDRLKVIEQHLLSVTLLWILVFKFSILVFRPSILWTNPFGLIFFTGGTNGIYLASLLGILYFYWKMYKSNIHFKTTTIIVIPSIAIIVLSYFIMMYFL